MPLPIEDVRLVDEWVNSLNSKMPAHAAERLKYRAESHRNAITLFECQLMGDDPATDWIEVPFARLRFTRSRGWELYWSDRNSDFHVYDSVEPTQKVAKLIDEIDRDPTCIFFG